MEYITSLVGPPGLGTVDVFFNGDGGYLAMQGRPGGAVPETRTSAAMPIFDLLKAIRSENDALLAWSPWS